MITNTHSFHTRAMAFNALFQITIIFLGNDIAKAVTLEAIQRFRLQKKHATKAATTNVAVFGTKNVMVMNG